MFKQITTGLTLMISAAAFSQVGIETETPQATLDVVGRPADASVLDGIIAPRLEGAQLRAKTYTSSQTGALVYVTLADTVPAGQTEDVTAPGYYYFNGTKWVTAGAGDMVNIYNADGTLTDDRYVTMNSNILRFSGTDGTMKIDNDGESEVAIQAINSNSARLRLDAGTSGLQVTVNSNGNVDLIGYPGGTNSLSFGTSTASSPSSDLRFYTTGITRMTINGIGNVGIGTTTPTERFHNIGNVRFQGLPLNGATNAIFTTSGGTASATQNQTFTASRTLVADANGVIGYVTGLPGDSDINIYQNNGTLTSNRTVNQGGRSLIFSNIQNTTFFNTAGSGLVQSSGTGTRASIALATAGGNQLELYTDNNAPSQIRNRGNSTGLIIGNSNTTSPGFVSFETTSAAGSTGEERMRINSIGNVGINIPTSTERFHNNGNVRLQGLPANGATNAIFTTSGGSASATQDQTFTASRTLVADANGVVGYVTGLPISNNIYTANGLLTSNRTVNINGYSLNFRGTQQETSWSSLGGMNLMNLQSGTGSTGIGFFGGNNSNFYIQQFYNGDTSLTSINNSKSFVIGTHGNVASAPISFITSAGSNASGTEKMRITGEGRIGIATTNPAAAVHVVKVGSDLTPAIIQGCNEYADNAAAVAAGLPVGGLYRKADGTLMVRY